MANLPVPRSTLTGMDVAEAVRTLDHTHAALNAGDADDANRLARTVLHDAEAVGEVAVQATALALLAHSDRLTSKSRRSLEASQQAGFLFRLCGDVAGEVGALATASHAASSLGRNEEAVEAALLAVRLGEKLAVVPQLAISYNNLGIAYFWSRDFENASVALEHAIAVADDCRSLAAAFRPRMNRVCAESLRLSTHRFYSGNLPDTSQMVELMDICSNSVRDDTFACLAEGMKISAKSVQMLFAGLVKCWSGDFRGANADVDAGLAWANRYPTTTWLNALERWMRTEIAWAQARFPEAQVFAQQMLSLSSQIEHEQLACLAHLLLAQLREIQGQPVEALGELRSLRRREERIRGYSLQSRSRVVAWQLDIRHNEHNLRTLQSASQKFERLSNEDSLTGLGNRRFFEHRVKELLTTCAISSQSICLALLDVDLFKQVNDRFSHSVGDRVLQVIAEVLRQCVREQDVPARLAGDEFVVVLPNADISIAAQVCERVRVGVHSFDWATVAAGLRVTVSTGCVQAESGETFESLLHRSDLAMYAAKVS